MSGDTDTGGGKGGGDTSSGGDKGNSDAGGGGDSGGLGDYSSGGTGGTDGGGGGYVPQSGSPETFSPAFDNFMPYAQTGSNGPSVDEFVASPTGGDGGFDSSNLGGPGPVGGDSGLPGAGGGTNMPWANLPGMTGNEFNYLGGNGADNYTGPPLVSGGVSSTGGAPGSSPQSVDSFLGGSTLTDQLGTTESLATGTNAAAAAAPSGVAGNQDLSSSNRVQPGGTNQTAAVTRDRSLLDSLGLGGNSNGLGVLAAGAGLLNSFLNRGNNATPSVDALRGTATQNQRLIDDLLAQRATDRTTGQSQTNAGQRTTATGEDFLNTGREVQDQGRHQITSGQGQTEEGRVLQQYVQTGTLPAAYETQIQSGVQAAIQRLRSNYAQRGMPTDPEHNTTLAEEIRQIEARVPEMRMQMAQSLAGTGSNIVTSGNQTIAGGNALLNNGAITAGDSTINTGNSTITTGTNTTNSTTNPIIAATGLSSNVYNMLANIDQQRQQRTGAAIANFASALNGNRARPTGDTTRTNATV